MKYIDADRLKAEIERYEDTAIDAYNPLGEEADYWHGKVVACEDLKNLIDSLQQEQPEVNLEKEMKEYFKGWTETEEGIACHYQYVDLNTCHGIARHFYELGLNARKEE